MTKLLAAVLVVVYSIEWLADPPADAAYRATASLGLLPRQSIVLIELVTIVLFVACLEPALNKRALRKLLTTTCAIAGVLTLWAFANDLALVNVVLGFRQYLRPIPLFVAGYLFARKDVAQERLRIALTAMGVIAIAQIPVTVYQFMFVTRRAVAGQTPQDVVSGTFGPIDGGTLGMFLVACAGFVLAFKFSRGRLRPSAWMWVALFLLPPLLAGVRAVFVVLAGMIVAGFIFLPGDVRLWSRLATVLGLGVIGGAGLVAFDRFVEPGFMEDFGVEYLARHFSVATDGERLTRGAAVLYSGVVISDTPSSVIFGKGVGSATRNFVGGPQAPYYHFESDRSILSRLLIEGGVVGVGMMLFALWRIYRIGGEVWRASEAPLVRATALGVVLATWVAAASLLYGDVLTRPQFAYPYWFLAAYITAVAHQRFGGPLRGDEHRTRGETTHVPAPA